MKSGKHLQLIYLVDRASHDIRVNTKGIPQANKCMLMSAIAYNLKKLLKFTTNRVEANAEALQKSLKTSLLLELTAINKRSNLKPASC